MANEPIIQLNDVTKTYGGGATAFQALKGVDLAIEDGEILFKTEVGAASPHACQLQGVWVRPDRRGEGIAAAALAHVVRLVRRDVAPLVTLYVNDHNVPARALYERVGFTERATFALCRAKCSRTASMT